MRFTFFISFILMLTCSIHSQNIQEMPSGIKLETDDVSTSIEFINSRIVHVTKSVDDKIQPKTSLSVIKTPERINIEKRVSNESVLLKSADLWVTADMKTGRIVFLSPDGECLLNEKDYGMQFTPTYDGQKMSYTVRQAFKLDKQEKIYGLGQLQNGMMSQRNQRIVLKHQNTKVCIPFFQSIKGYGIFWDNYASTIFNDNPQETSFESLGEVIDYYFLYGENSDGVVACMRDLTGQAPMIPLWAFGFFQSKERYKTQDELVGVVKEYRRQHIPLDCIVQDWRYWGADTVWNAMNFDKVSHPDPKKMVEDIHGMNAKLMIVAWPGFGPKTQQFKDFDAKKMLIDFNTWPPGVNSKPYDVYSSEARKLYWGYLSNGVFKYGIDAWWLDSTEPDHVNPSDDDFKKPTALGAYGAVCNAFPLMHVGGVYENHRLSGAHSRVCILTRSAFAGQQRYAANTWSGDIVASWETLQRQLPAALNFSMTGIPYWNSDIGGFFLWNYGYAKAPENNAFRELYARWMQFGIFCPMMRSHGASGASREIYRFGKRGERHFDALEKAIRLRYSLLPYIYSTAWGVTDRDESFMRPLFAEFSQDERTWEMTDQFLFGKSFMVAPVMNSMYVTSQDGNGSETYDQIKSRKIYFPKDSEWVDFWTGQMVKGGSEIEREVPIDIIPIYVKAGTVLPIGPQVEFAEQKPWDNLEIRVYPGANGKFDLYEDENNNYNYEKGERSIISFNWDDDKGVLTISDRVGRFNGMLKKRKFSLVVVKNNQGTGDGLSFNTKVVNYSGKKLKIKLK